MGFLSPHKCASLLSAAEPLYLLSCPQHVLWSLIPTKNFPLHCPGPIIFSSKTDSCLSLSSELILYLWSLPQRYDDDALSSNISNNFQFVLSPKPDCNLKNKDNVFYLFLLIIPSSWYPICFPWSHILLIFIFTIFIVYVFVSYSKHLQDKKAFLLYLSQYQSLC